MVGVTVHTRAADARAAACDAGARGEQMTATLLTGLAGQGWWVLHDRAIPGCTRANADHVVVSPGGRLFLVDSKLWSKKTGGVHVRAGRLWHGGRFADKAVDSLLFEALMVERAVRVPVQPLMAVHSAPVAGEGFEVRGVPVVPASRLVPLLVGNDVARDAGALWVAQAVAEKLPPYPR